MSDRSERAGGERDPGGLGSVGTGRDRPRRFDSHASHANAISRLTFPAGHLYLRPALLVPGPEARGAEEGGTPPHGDPGAARVGRGSAAPLSTAQPRDARARRRGRGRDGGRRARRRSSARARRSRTGRRSPIEERGRVLQRAVRVLLARQDEFVAVIRARDRQARGRGARDRGARGAATRSRSTRSARSASSPTARVPVHLMKNKKLRISYRPLGVVGIITPWNFPFMLSLNPTVAGADGGQRRAC